jgi:hypothetical protein
MKLVVLTLLIGCGGAETPRARPEDYPTRLRPPTEIEGDFTFEQEVTIRYGEEEHSFRAVLQKAADEIVLVALGPHGGRGFMLQQRGTAVEFENYLPVEIPFPPEFILYDVHRTWFVAPTPPDDGEGPSTVERDGERITERWRAGRLEERRFERLDGRPAGAIVVRYRGGMDLAAPRTAAPPASVELDNGWFGYRTAVRTIEWRPLGGAAP